MPQLSAAKRWTIKNRTPLITLGIILLLVGMYVLLPVIIGVIKESRVQYATPVGQLQMDNQPIQQLAIVKYLEQYDASIGIATVCSATVFGYDSAYIYGYTICEQKNAEGVLLGLGTDYGRYTYSGPAYRPTVTKKEAQGNDNSPSLESLYPAAIYHIAMPHVTH